MKSNYTYLLRSSRSQNHLKGSSICLEDLFLMTVLLVGIGTGNPGVFLGYLYPQSGVRVLMDAGCGLQLSL